MYIQSYAPFLYFLFLSSNYKSVQNNKKVPFKKKKKKRRRRREEKKKEGSSITKLKFIP